MSNDAQIQKLKKDLESTKSKVLKDAIKEKIKRLEDNEGIRK